MNYTLTFRQERDILIAETRDDKNTHYERLTGTVKTVLTSIWERIRNIRENHPNIILNPSNDPLSQEMWTEIKPKE